MDLTITKASASLSTQNPLAQNISLIPGIGPKTAETLAKHEIHSIFDLLLHPPKSIVTQTEAPGFLHMESGRHYIVSGKVVAIKITGSAHKRRLEAILQDETGRISVVFFGPAVNYAHAILKEQAVVTISGEAKDFLGRIQMVHPKLLTKNEQTAASNLATYAQIGGINSAAFKRIIDKALYYIKNKPNNDYLNNVFLKTHGIAELFNAFSAIHELNDEKWDQRVKSPYFRRLAFEEVLSFYVRLTMERKPKQITSSPIIAKAKAATLAKDFVPFDLTKAQTRVTEEIIDDLSHAPAMARLLQGDVGSGKTAVSALIALHVAHAGYQVAVMAPTEILAGQLFSVFQNFFNNKPFSLALLTASQKTKTRRIIAEGIGANQVHIVIGTHALLSADIQFSRLGLLIIDEQHRFGVKQRSDLITSCAKRQGFTPHLLVMSATPIPRSLALTVYGDLDLSVIDERPKGRVPIHTQVFTGPVLDTMARLCERILATNQKAFIVFPLIEESEHLDLQNATKAVALLQEKFGASKAKLLHGKMKTDEKTSTMEQFKAGTISLLVSTTVVEVGVDIPDATCMIIIHPERFGLAQLHQLRGRVGRKDLKSFCFLATDITNRFGTAYKRLDALCKTDNGFKLAEIDLEIRGPGELLGVKQAGLPQFVIFNHADFADLIAPAKAYAKTIVDNGLRPEHFHLFLNKSTHFS